MLHDKSRVVRVAHLSCPSISNKDELEGRWSWASSRFSHGIGLWVSAVMLSLSEVVKSAKSARARTVGS